MSKASDFASKSRYQMSLRQRNTSQQHSESRSKKGVRGGRGLHEEKSHVDSVNPLPSPKGDKPRECLRDSISNNFSKSLALSKFEEHCCDENIPQPLPTFAPKNVENPESDKSLKQTSN